MMNKYVNFKVEKGYRLHALIFSFIAIVNVIMLLFGEPLEASGYRGWAFFLSSVIFFSFPEKELAARMLKLACGVVTGCVLAYTVIILYVGPLAELGVFGLIIPIIVSLMLLFLIGPFIPLCFNMCSFAYFTVSFVNAEEAVTNVIPNIIFGLLGVLVLSGGFVLILKWHGREKK